MPDAHPGCVVAENVDSSIDLRGRFHNPAGIGFHRYVSRHAAVGRLDIGRHHMRTGIAEQLRYGVADAVGRARYCDDAPFHAVAHGQSFHSMAAASLALVV